MDVLRRSRAHPLTRCGCPAAPSGYYLYVVSLSGRRGGLRRTRSWVFDVLPALGALRTLSARTAFDKVRARSWSTRYAIVVSRDLTRPSLEPQGAPVIDVAFVAPDAFPDLRSTLPNARDADALTLAAMERTRAEGAGELVLAYETGRLAALHFIHTGEHQERLERVSPHLYAPLGPREALTEGVFVLPEFRGRGIGPAMLRASGRELGGRGFSRALAVVDVENARSLRAFHGAGFVGEQTVRVDTYRLGRRTSSFAAGDRHTRRRYLDAIGAAALLVATAAQVALV
jgi:GNAT superfamily N-acetyltransferase